MFTVTRPTWNFFGQIADLKLFIAILKAEMIILNEQISNILSILICHKQTLFTLKTDHDFDKNISVLPFKRAKIATISELKVCIKECSDVNCAWRAHFNLMHENEQ